MVFLFVPRRVVLTIGAGSLFSVFAIYHESPHDLQGISVSHDGGMQSEEFFGSGSSATNEAHRASSAVQMRRERATQQSQSSSTSSESLEKSSVESATSQIQNKLSSRMSLSEQRAQAVKDEAIHCWRGYRSSPAWGHDDVKPDSGAGNDWIGDGVQIIEGLDTYFLMGAERELAEGLSYLNNDMNPMKGGREPGSWSVGCGAGR